VIPLDDSSNQPPSPVGAGEAGSVAPGEERATEAWLLPLPALVVGIALLARARCNRARYRSATPVGGEADRVIAVGLAVGV
jgi:hypothetical protein